jgi:hypothetical protein
MSRFTRSEADEQYSNATSTLRIAKRNYEQGGSQDLLDTQHLQAVADWLSATEQRIASYRDHLLQLIHQAEALSDVESGELATMLAEVAHELFPKPGRTLFDKRSLAARATGLDSDSPNLKSFRVGLADLRDEIAVLVEWYDWYRGETGHDPAGMFSAIRKKHDLTKRIAVRLDKIAIAFDRLREEAAQNKGGSSGNGS